MKRYTICFKTAIQMTFTELQAFIEDLDTNGYLTSIVPTVSTDVWKVVMHTKLSEKLVGWHEGYWGERLSYLDPVELTVTEGALRHSHPDTIQEVMKRVRTIFPEASWEKDNNGQFVIYTGCSVITEDIVVPVQ